MQQQRKRDQTLRAKKRPQQRRKSRRSRFLLPVVGILGVGVVVLAMILGRSSPGGTNQEGGEFPSYAYNSTVTLDGYKAAAANQDILPGMPCYCGCGPSEMHASLRDCFFKKDGSFNDHASNCHVCVEEASFVAERHAAGQSAKEIRAQVEKKFSSYGPPTNTPPITA